MSSESTGKDPKLNKVARDEDGTRSRTRVSRACTRCRNRKDRCDGLRPSCTACINAQQTCWYEPSTKKRGLPEGYVRGLEKLLALLMGKIKGFEDITGSLLKDNRELLSKIWNHAAIGEELHSIWKDSSIVAELESLLSSLDQSSHTSHKRKRDRDDDGAHEDPDFDTTFHITSEYRLSDLTGNSKVSHAPMVSASSIPDLPQQALRLLDQYFAHTNCWFPILRRPDLTRACYEMARGHTTTSDRAVSPLLWAIFSYAAQQDKSSDYVQSDRLSSNEMYNISLRLLPVKAEDFTLVHAQALLVLSLIDIGHGLWKSAWMSIGRAVRIVLMSLHDRIELVKATVATLQGCFVLDIAVASHLKCSPHLKKHDIAMIPRMAEDGHEEWEPWNGLDGYRGHRDPSFSFSCFNRLTEIFSVIGEALSIRPQARTADSTEVQGLLTRLHDLQSRFPGQMPPSANSPPHQIYLQLCHVSAQMLLVELPVDIGARSAERAKLACNILSLLTLCKNAPAITLAYLPPFCFDGFATAIRLARTSTDGFGRNHDLPSFNDFVQTSEEYIKDLAVVWPSFKKLDGSDPVTTRSGMILSDSADDTPQSYRASNGNRGVGPTNIVDPEQQDATITNQGINLWMISAEEDNATATQIADSTGSAVQDNILNDGALDKFLGTNNAHAPPDISIVDASPSFNGDEVDAIFHEMAHLDTNDWTNERVIGLKDFGFSDDLTFQAFCNDPDRLTGPEENGRMLSSSLQSWMFTNEPG